VCVTGLLELEKFQRKDGTEGSALRMIADEVAISLRWGKRDTVAAGAGDDISGF